MNENNYYFIRVGEGSKYITQAHKGGFVALGWNEVPNLENLENPGQIKNALENTSQQLSPTQIASYAGQLYRFAHEINAGDIIFSPLSSKEFLLGTAGEYYYEKNPQGPCNYNHRRHVQWQKQTILKGDMSTNLSYATGASQTLFSLDKYARELQLLMGLEPSTPAEKPEGIRNIVLENLFTLDGKAFEEFISHILEIVGFTAETTQYAGDKGIDVNGVLDAEGLASITLRVQVKRRSGSISNKEVLALRGALSQSEHGCLITLSRFTKQAVEEAQAPYKTAIKLIDGDDLAGLILKHFDLIDDQYKKVFGIRKKKDFNIEEQFEPVVEPEPAVPGSENKTVQSLATKNVDIKTGKTSKPKETKKMEWDSLLCPAQEDGFQDAFMTQRAWWAVSLSKKKIPFIKYIAMYQVAPVSQITYYGEIDRIEPYKDTGKYQLFLKGEPVKLEKPVGLGENRRLAPQSAVYASLNKILEAKTLDDVFVD